MVPNKENMWPRGNLCWYKGSKTSPVCSEAIYWGCCVYFQSTYIEGGLGRAVTAPDSLKVNPHCSNVCTNLCLRMFRFLCKMGFNKSINGEFFASTDCLKWTLKELHFSESELNKLKWEWKKIFKNQGGCGYRLLPPKKSGLELQNFTQLVKFYKFLFSIFHLS